MSPVRSRSSPPKKMGETRTESKRVLLNLMLTVVQFQDGKILVNVLGPAGELISTREPVNIEEAERLLGVAIMGKALK